MKIVRVCWLDSQSDITWQLLKELDNNIVEVVSYGALIRENDEEIIIAQNYIAQNEQISNTTAIPKRCVLHIAEIYNEREYDA